MSRTLILIFVGTVIFFVGCGQEPEGQTETPPLPELPKIVKKPAMPQAAPSPKLHKVTEQPLLKVPGSDEPVTAAEHPPRLDLSHTLEPQTYPENSGLSLPRIIAPVDAQQSELSPEKANTAREALKILVEAHNSGNGEQWEQAHTKLLAFGEQAIPTVVKAIVDGNAETREMASIVLPGLGIPPASTHQTLLTLLDSSSLFVQMNIASSLSQTGQHADKLIPRLIPVLKDSEKHLRMQAVYTLGNYGPEAAPAVSALVSLLEQTTDEEILDALFMALGQMGPAAKSALTPLQQLEGRVSGSLAESLRVCQERIQETNVIP